MELGSNWQRSEWANLNYETNQGRSMAIKVRHRKNNKVYLLLGVGFGAYKATRPSMLLGNLAPNSEEGKVDMMAMCDSTGTIYWARSGDMEVIEVDGATPAELLA